MRPGKKCEFNLKLNVVAQTVYVDPSWPGPPDAQRAAKAKAAYENDLNGGDQCNLTFYLEFSLYIDINSPDNSAKETQAILVCLLLQPLCKC